VRTPPRSVVIRSTSGEFEPRFIAARKFLIDISADVSAITWSRTVRDSQLLNPQASWVFKTEADYGGGFKNYSSHLKFMLFTYKSLKLIEPNLVYACDLDTLIPSLIWGRKKTAVVIFDQFDPLSAKTSNLILTRLLDKLELVLSRKANFRVTPNSNRIPRDFVSKWIEIKNLFEFEIPETTNLLPFDRFQLFYGGVLSKDRGLLALSSAVLASPQWEFEIYGQGPEFAELAALNNPHIKAKGLLGHKLLMNKAQKAHLYAALYDPKFKHNKQTASNKLFEAAQLGIPLLASKNTYLGDIVEKYRLGWTVHFDDVPEIIDVLVKCGNLELEGRDEVKLNLQDYFASQLSMKHESLNRLSRAVTKAFET
jgi:succinoglycan biosynthesis protein ExoL